MPPPRSERVPLALYLHFPWCVRKCPYCDFNSHTARGEVPEHEYIDALLRDLDWELEGLGPERRPLVSIFMGGGTPSLFSGAAIGRLLEQVARRLNYAPDIEITLEANPGTADAGNFRGYAAAGVNRLSMGVQSLNAQHLKSLGRIHGPEEALNAYGLARAAGIANINLDLMFALPQQTAQQAEADLRALVSLQPEHISYYQLTLEPNTEFAARPPPLPDQDESWAMQEFAWELLAQAGYLQYEVSAYAREGRQSAHNLNYWRYGDYLGIGAGAHGKLSRASGIERRARHRHPKAYLGAAGSAAAVQETLSIRVEELPFEFCMNALRLRTGFDLADFEARTGQPASVLEGGLAEARRLGLIEPHPDRVQPSAHGWRHLNRLMALFL